MNSRFFKISALAAFLLCAGTLYAHSNTAAPNAGTAFQQAESVTIMGQLTSADEKGLTVTDTTKVEHKVGVAEATKVTKGGKDATLADLKLNDRVTVVAMKASDGSLTASSIDITSAE